MIDYEHDNRYDIKSKLGYVPIISDIDPDESILQNISALDSIIDIKQSHYNESKLKLGMSNNIMTLPTAT